MTADQKRLLTNPKGKLSKVNLSAILGNDEAWALLPKETRQQLYALLPPPHEGEAEYDVDAHPFNTHVSTYIKQEIDRWQRDLQEGREVKIWRLQALQAGKDRIEGKWDEWKEQQRELDWAKAVEHELPKDDSDGLQKGVEAKE